MNASFQRFARAALGLAFALFALPGAAATFQVNAGNNLADQTPGDGTCAASNGTCTLRAAIQEANALAASAPHRITFAAGVTTVSINAQGLPAINVPLEIDGNRADPANPRVVINGGGQGGFQFNDSASQTFDPSPPMGAIKSGLFNLVIHNFSGDGVSLSGRGFTVQNCYIGVLGDGETASANTGHGISISSPMPMNPLPDLGDIDIGDVDLGDIDAVIAFLTTALAALNAPTFIDGNLISGNGLDGVRIFGEHTAMVFVRGNRIGINADGDLAIPNGAIGQGNGVQVLSSAFANFIGPFNLIAGNNRPGSGANGIFLNAGAVRFPNFVAGNLIGPGGTVDPLNFDPFNPNISDLLDFGNLENGIRIDTRRSTTTPENFTPYSAIIGPANLVSFNGTATPAIDNLNADPNAGVLITGNAADVYMLTNIIGGLRLEVGGNPQLIGGNKGDGVHITSSNHQIGGASIAERNVVSGNGRHGIVIRGSSTNNITVQGNLIGRDLLNLLDFGQGGDGIHVNAASVLTIGGDAENAGNVVASNQRNGIKITNGSSTSGWANLVSRNSIFRNGLGGTGIGIDLEQVQNAPDPADDLPAVPTNWANNGQNAPIICTGQMGAPAACGAASGPTYDVGADQVSMTAILQSRPSTDYVIEMFLADAPGNMGNGEGRRFMASLNVSTDAGGLAIIPATVNAPVGGATGSFLTLTATAVNMTTRPDGSMGPANNSSEFSAAVAVVTPGTLEFTPDMLAFGTVNVGANADLATTLSHVDGDAVTGITLDVTGSGFSVQTSTCGMAPFTLGPGQSCVVTVRFAPGVAGAAMGNLTANAGVGTGDSVALTGTGQIPGSLDFTDASLDLGNVVVGNFATATTTLQNPGGAAVTNVVLQVTGSGFSRDGGTCPTMAFTLAAMDSCTVTVRFQPAMAGAAMGSLGASGDGGTSDSVALSGNGLAPASLAYDAASYDFGTVVVGATGMQTATLSNAGGVDATNVTVGVSGTGFTRTGGTCSMAAFTLGAGMSCTVEMEFAPLAAGMASGMVSASGDGGLTATASLAGNAITAGALAFDPAALDFGDVPVGNNPTLSTTLSNTGGAAITGITFMVSGTGFARDGGTCPMMAFDLPGGGDCTVVIRFTPAAGGPANGTLAANSADGGASATLAGNGLAPASLAFDLPDYAFGNVTVGVFGELTATLSNAGGQDASNVQVMVGGTGFSRNGGSCGMAAFTLAAGANCSVVLRFTPAAPGAASGSVSASGDGGLSASATLSGTGIAPGALAFDPAVLAFGDVVTGGSSMLTTTLRNNGGVSVDNIALGVTGTGYSRDGGTCPTMAFNLAGGADCTVTIRFQPAATGAANGSLGANGDGGASASASLTGNGIAPGALAFSPMNLAFGDVAVGSNATLSTTLTNNGGATIDDIALAVTGTGFSRDGGTCPTVAFSLASMANCTLVVRFEPAAPGAASGSASATATMAAASANLTGNGISAGAGAVGFLPLAGLNFGNVVVGSTATQTITITNTGNQPLTTMVVGVTGPFVLSNNPCPATLAAAASCVVSIQFTPGVVGAAAGQVQVTADGGINASAPLSGTGIAAPPVAPPVMIPTLDRFGLALLLLAFAGLAGWQFGAGRRGG